MCVSTMRSNNRGRILGYKVIVIARPAMAAFRFVRLLYRSRHVCFGSSKEVALSMILNKLSLDSQFRSFKELRSILIYKYLIKAICRYTGIQKYERTQDFIQFTRLHKPFNAFLSFNFKDFAVIYKFEMFISLTDMVMCLITYLNIMLILNIKYYFQIIKSS